MTFIFDICCSILLVSGLGVLMGIAWFVLEVARKCIPAFNTWMESVEEDDWE